MLKILGRTTSSNVQKVLWLCEELGVAYERDDVGGPFGRNREPDYLKLNPNGLVPVIIDDGFVLWESNTILRYLASSRQPGVLLPDDPKRRALVEQWMDWELSVAVGPMGTVFKQLIRTPAAERDPDLIARESAHWCDVMKILEGQLAYRDFVAGNQFSLADIALGSNAYRFLNVPIARPELPHLEHWFRRLAERPGCQKHVMVTLA